MSSSDTVSPTRCFNFRDSSLKKNERLPSSRRNSELKSATLRGIFFEDINNSLDGGICAQLIQNNSFQAYNVPDAPEHEFSVCDSVFFGWTIVRKGDARGSARAVADKPLVKNLKRHYDFDPNDKYDDEQRYKQYSVRFEVKNPGDGFGIAANGFGIADTEKAKNITIPTIPKLLLFRL